MRRASQAGGNAVVLARGDPDAGAILIVCRERGRLTALLERVLHPQGYRWTPTGQQGDTDSNAGDTDPSESQADAWIAGRRSRDPDLWVIELDIADAERFAAGIGSDD